MSTFDSSIIDTEGGYNDIPEDKGGPTKYGISQRSYPDLDIKNLTSEQAIDIYKRDYWNKYGLSLIDTQDIANQVFLLMVNIGVEPAIRIIQRAINSRIGNYFPIKIDGAIGGVTIHYLNLFAHEGLKDSISVSECRYYLSIVDEHPSQEIFFKGWIRRALL